MAVTVAVDRPDTETQIATYVGDANAGDGPAVQMAPYVIGLTVQRVSGTGTYTVQGSQNGTTWGALSTAISAANDDNLRSIANAPRFLRVVTASAAATVIISGVHA